MDTSQFGGAPTRRKTFIRDYKMTQETREVLKIETIKNFKNAVKNKLIRQVLTQDPEERSDKDLQIIEPLIKETQFMQNRKEMTQADFNELCRSLCFLELDEFENVFEYGEIGDTFYIIIQGVVSIQLRNNNIKNWAYARKQYNKLLKWKELEFDPRVADAQEKWNDDQAKKKRMMRGPPKRGLEKQSTLDIIHDMMTTRKRSSGQRESSLNILSRVSGSLNFKPSLKDASQSFMADSSDIFTKEQVIKLKEKRDMMERRETTESVFDFR